MKKRLFLLLVLFTTLSIGIKAQVFMDPAGNSGYMINKCYVKKPMKAPHGMKPGASGYMIDNCYVKKPIKAPHGMKPGASGYMIDNCKVNGVPVSAPTQVESRTTKRYSSSSNKIPCPACDGTGRVRRQAPDCSFGINTEKVRCSECGEMMFKSGGHLHKPCEQCHGKKYISY